MKKLLLLLIIPFLSFGQDNCDVENYTMVDEWEVLGTSEANSSPPAFDIILTCLEIDYPVCPGDLGSIYISFEKTGDGAGSVGRFRLLDMQGQTQGLSQTFLDNNTSGSFTMSIPYENSYYLVYRTFDPTFDDIYYEDVIDVDSPESEPIVIGQVFVQNPWCNGDVGFLSILEISGGSDELTSVSDFDFYINEINPSSLFDPIIGTEVSFFDIDGDGDVEGNEFEVLIIAVDPLTNCSAYSTHLFYLLEEEGLNPSSGVLCDELETEECMDPAACNYLSSYWCGDNPCAYTGDLCDNPYFFYDENCECSAMFLPIVCEDIAACNYGDTLPFDPPTDYWSNDGSGYLIYDSSCNTISEDPCVYEEDCDMLGCSNIYAWNFDGLDYVDDGSCCYYACCDGMGGYLEGCIEGCMSSSACDYNPEATTPCWFGADGDGICCDYESCLDNPCDTIYVDNFITDTIIETEYIELTDTLFIDNFITDTIIETEYVDVIEYVDIIITEYIDCDTGLPCTSGIAEIIEKSKTNGKLYNLLGQEVFRREGIYIEVGEIKYRF